MKISPKRANDEIGEKFFLAKVSGSMVPVRMERQLLRLNHILYLLTNVQGTEYPFFIVAVHKDR